MSDKLAGIIGGGGILATFTVEIVNSYAALIIALLTIGILFPKFLASIPKTCRVVSVYFDRVWEWLRNRKKPPPGL